MFDFGAFRYSNGGRFSFDGEWIHPKRKEVTYEIIYVLSGEVCINESGKEYYLKKGNLLLLEPDKIHAGSHSTVNTEFYWLHFFTQTLPFEQRFFDRFDSAYLIRELLHFSNNEKCPSYLKDSMLVRIISELMYQAERENSTVDPLASRIYEYIRSHSYKKMTVNLIAEKFSISKDYLTRLLKKNYGRDAIEIKNGFLINEAKRLLNDTDKYVKEISFDLNFPSSKAFIAFFRYHVGISPQKYREKYGSLHMNSR